MSGPASSIVDPLSPPDPPASLSLRRVVGLTLGPALFFLTWLAPLGLDPPAHSLAAIFALVVVLWVTEAIPLAATALLGPALAVPLGVAPANDAFAAFGNKIIFLFLGSFVLARAMALHRLDRRIALFVLSRRWVGDHPARILLAFGGIGAFLSMWMSNTATTAMMLPIALGVLRTLPRDEDEETRNRQALGLMLMIAFSCEIGGLATPIGTPPNLIAKGYLEEILGREITFFGWMRFGVPLALLCFGLLFLLMRRVALAGAPRVTGASRVIHEARAKLGPWSAGEKAALAAFLVAVALWTLPGFLVVILGSQSALAHGLKQALPEAVVAILAAVLLFIIPIEKRTLRPALEWREAAGIDWGTILLFGGGLSLGSLAFSTGLATALGSALAQVGGRMPLWVLVIGAIFVAALLTEFMSNTATANLLVPIFIGVAQQADISPVLPAVAATLGCSLAFCLPVATPPNAIVYGSGQVPLAKMIRHGIVLDVGCGLLVWAGLLVFSRGLGL